MNCAHIGIRSVSRAWLFRVHSLPVSRPERIVALRTNRGPHSLDFPVRTMSWVDVMINAAR